MPHKADKVDEQLVGHDQNSFAEDKKGHLVEVLDLVMNVGDGAWGEVDCLVKFDCPMGAACVGVGVVFGDVVSEDLGHGELS